MEVPAQMEWILSPASAFRASLGISVRQTWMSVWANPVRMEGPAPTMSTVTLASALRDLMEPTVRTTSTSALRGEQPVHSGTSVWWERGERTGNYKAQYFVGQRQGIAWDPGHNHILLPSSWFIVDTELAGQAWWHGSSFISYIRNRKSYNSDPFSFCSF